MDVKKYSYLMPVNVIGTDEQGRTLVQCPSRGCGDTAYIDIDGRLVCPTGEAIEEFLSHSVAELDAAMSTLEAARDALPDRD